MEHEYEITYRGNNYLVFTDYMNDQDGNRRFYHFFIRRGTPIPGHNGLHGGMMLMLAADAAIHVPAEMRKKPQLIVEENDIEEFLNWAEHSLKVTPKIIQATFRKNRFHNPGTKVYFVYTSIPKDELIVKLTYA